MSEKMLPEFIRRDVERAIEAAINPKGMSVHDGKALIGADRLQYMLNFIDALRTHENGGQESEAGAVAWVDGDDAQRILAWGDIAAFDIAIGAKLYLAPPSATAIEYVAIMRAAAAVACPGRTIFDTEKAIIALIPKDGRTQLEEFGMKVATETRAAVLINTREDLFTEDSSLRAIVTNLIGVTPLSSEIAVDTAMSSKAASVSGEKK